MLKIKSSEQRNCVLDFQNVFSSRKRFVFLIFSLLCTIILLTQPAVALPKPTLAQPISSSLIYSPSSKSLVMILPQVNANNARMLSVLEQETSFKQSVDILTPGQQVINAVPEKERGDFIMHELAIALKNTDDDDDVVNQQRWLRNLKDVEEFYGNKITGLKNVPIYENFSTDILQWIEEKFNLTHQNVYNQLRSRSQLLCTSNGVCYDAKNIGCYCCPF